MRQLRILLREHKIVENLLSPGWFHRVECTSEASVSYQDISNVNELKRCINSEWAALRHAVIERAAYINWALCNLPTWYT